MLLWTIEEKNPLKQGLKLNHLACPTVAECIEEKNPLKQGLKPKQKAEIEENNKHWREESIKTRIETYFKSP